MDHFEFVNVAWLAGFSDGEGCFGCYGPSRRPKVTLTQAVKSMLEEIALNTDNADLKISYSDGAYRLQLTGPRALWFCRLVYPYMRHPAKIRRAREILKWGREKGL